jgi:hypothetical protein
VLALIAELGQESAADSRVSLRNARVSVVYGPAPHLMRMSTNLMICMIAMNVKRLVQALGSPDGRHVWAHCAALVELGGLAAIRQPAELNTCRLRAAAWAADLRYDLGSRGRRSAAGLGPRRPVACRGGRGLDRSRLPVAVASAGERCRLRWASRGVGRWSGPRTQVSIVPDVTPAARGSTSLVKPDASVRRMNLCQDTEPIRSHRFRNSAVESSSSSRRATFAGECIQLLCEGFGDLVQPRRPRRISLQQPGTQPRPPSIAPPSSAGYATRLRQPPGAAPSSTPAPPSQMGGDASVKRSTWYTNIRADSNRCRTSVRPASAT